MHERRAGDEHHLAAPARPRTHARAPHTAEAAGTACLSPAGRRHPAPAPEPTAPPPEGEHQMTTARSGASGASGATGAHTPGAAR
jgi:hypothetical protein